MLQLYLYSECACFRKNIDYNLTSLIVYLIANYIYMCFCVSHIVFPTHSRKWWRLDWTYGKAKWQNRNRNRRRGGKRWGCWTEKIGVCFAVTCYKIYKYRYSKKNICFSSACSWQFNVQMSYALCYRMYCKKHRLSCFYTYVHTRFLSS